MASLQVIYFWVMDANQAPVNLDDLQDAYELLTTIDRNNDGQITRTELRERLSTIASQWAAECFDCHDADEDNQITRSEAEGSHLAQRFDRLDANSDGRLSRSELRQAVVNGSSARTASGSTSRDRESDERR